MVDYAKAYDELHERYNIAKNNINNLQSEVELLRQQIKEKEH